MSSAKKISNKIKKIIEDYDFTNFLKKYSNTKELKEKNKIKKKFSTAFLTYLNTKLLLDCYQSKWKGERQCSSEHKDAYDFFSTLELSGEEVNVIIELDATRADQVAKKFLSRVNFNLGNSCIYFALCYKGTKNMSIPEVEKYFNYCAKISEFLNTNGKFINLFHGVIMQGD